MRGRARTILRPTGRGVVVLVACAALWLLGDLTRIEPARQLAAGLVLVLAVGAIGILVAGRGISPRRRVVDDAVPVGGSARVMLEMQDRLWITVVPLGRGVVREHLPEELGGQGDLPLARRMPHVLRVSRRGGHALGPYSVLVRDVFGLFHLRRTVEDGLRITGLPVVAEMSTAAERSTGIADSAVAAAAPVAGVGEIGPIARPYATGDDIRRIHWRASARTGTLMTREDEPTAGRSAVVVLDTTRRDGLEGQVEEALVSHAATVLDSLGRNGWEVRIVDASGDEITRTQRRRGVPGPSLLGGEADALERRASLLALAEVDFDDDEQHGVGRDHAAGHAELAIALGADLGEPFAGLELDRFAGRATRRTAIALEAALPEEEPETLRRARRIGPADGDDFGHAHEQHAEQLAAARAQRPPRRSRLGTWALVRGSSADTLDDLLTTAVEEPR
ncbi:DUF58 domain-containing protein [Brachybacterium paraconglomeratum]